MQLQAQLEEPAQAEQEASSVESSDQIQAHTEHTSAYALASPTAETSVQSSAAEAAPTPTSASGLSADGTPAECQGYARPAAAQQVSTADMEANAHSPRCCSIADEANRQSAGDASQQQVPEARTSQIQTCGKPSRNSRRARKKLSSSAETCDSSGGCIVCWSAAACIIFQPCGHFCCCVTCAQPFLAGEPCPICRSPVAAAIAVDTVQSADRILD